MHLVRDIVLLLPDVLVRGEQPCADYVGVPVAPHKAHKHAVVQPVILRRREQIEVCKRLERKPAKGLDA